jgi:hypothetical protein
MRSPVPLKLGGRFSSPTIWLVPVWWPATVLTRIPEWVGNKQGKETVKQVDGYWLAPFRQSRVLTFR